MLNKKIIVPIFALMSLALINSCSGAAYKHWYEYTEEEKWWEYCSNDGFESATDEDIGKEVDLTINGLVHKVRLIGIDHDDLVNGGKAHCTFEFVNLLSDSDGYSLATPWNWGEEVLSVNYNFLDSNLRKALDGEGEANLCWYQKGATEVSITYTKSVLEMLPNDLQSVLKKVKKPIAMTSSYEITSYNTKLFVLSLNENSSTPYKNIGDGSSYQFYEGSGDTDDNRIKHQIKWHEGAVTSSVEIDELYENYAGYNSDEEENYGGMSWLRTPNKSYYSLIYITDVDGHNYSELDYSLLAVAPAFCI